MEEASNLLRKEISGWSNTNSSISEVAMPKTTEEVKAVILQAKKNGKKIIARGAGQSYGDQSLNKDGVVIDTKKLDGILSWDKNHGILKVQAGMTYEQVLLHCLNDNWIMAVIPGTRYVTMGGALANNVHGKNSYSRGNFGEWVKEFKIITASGEELNCSPDDNADLFFGAIGGAGLLGIITELTLQLVQIPSPFLAVIRKALPSLDCIMNDLEKATQEQEFAIAQIDCFPKDSHLGRGTMHAAKFISHTKQISPTEMKYISKTIFGVPKIWIPFFGQIFLNNFVMKLVSAIKYYLDTKTSSNLPHIQDVFQFIFFLDKVPDWKKVFRHGFFEYEPLIPKNKAKETIKKLITLTHKFQMPVYLSAIKVHKKDNFLLSYSLDGYSFAIDIPRFPKNKEKQDKLFREMNRVVIDAGGIVYLAKDAHLTQTEFKIMYKNFNKFMSLKNKYDPHEVFQSDMYGRIFK